MRLRNLCFVAGDERRLRSASEPWRFNDAVRRRRLQEQGKRTLAQNLEEGLALSRFLSSFSGAARR